MELHFVDESATSHVFVTPVVSNMAETVANYVDGEWREARTGDTTAVYNPADPDEVVSRVQQSSEEDAAGAVEAAAEAQAEWANTPGTQRGAVLTEAARVLEDREEELTETLVREEGKTRAEANGEVNRAIDIFNYYGGKAVDVGGERKQAASRDSDIYSVTEPMGVAALVTPWNYPIAIPAWKMAPALATGNTVVLKPAEDAPTVSAMLVEALDEAGVPDGVVNYVTGPGEEVGGTVVNHEDVDVVSFTGSRSVGEDIYQQATDDEKRVQTELGSKNATVVMPSADVDAAASIVGAGAFGVTGQACTATERALVHEDVHDEFVDRLVEYAENVEVGSGLDEPDMGPQVNERELEETLEYVDVAQNEGATLEYGGSEVDGEDGYFVEPTVFTDVDPDMQVMQEEVFGPFVGVMPVSDFEEAVELTNDVDFGLTAGIVSNDHSEARRFVDEVDFGVVKINEPTSGLQYHVPFGGMNASSSETWREQGDAALDFYTIEKTVYENY